MNERSIDLAALMSCVDAYVDAYAASQAVRIALEPLQKTESAAKASTQNELLAIWGLGTTESEAKALVGKALREVKSHLELARGSTNARKVMERLQPIAIGNGRMLVWKFASGPRKNGSIGNAVVSIQEAPTFADQLRELTAQYSAVEILPAMKEALHKLVAEREQEQAIDILWDILTSKPATESLDELIEPPAIATPTITRHRKSNLVTATASS